MLESPIGKYRKLKRLTIIHVSQCFGYFLKLARGFSGLRFDMRNTFFYLVFLPADFAKPLPV
jgi:hypothetical protein